MSKDPISELKQERREIDRKLRLLQRVRDSSKFPNLVRTNHLGLGTRYESPSVFDVIGKGEPFTVSLHTPYHESPCYTEVTVWVDFTEPKGAKIRIYPSGCPYRILSGEYPYVHPVEDWEDKLRSKGVTAPVIAAIQERFDLCAQEWLDDFFSYPFAVEAVRKGLKEFDDTQKGEQ